MKKHVLFVGFLLFTCTAWSQNKTLGVGVSTPNPNAALHVEAPTKNQGFILPRLTTAERTATTFTSALGAADDGLIVYDLDQQAIYVWDGTAWTTSADLNFTGTGSAAKFQVNNAANQDAAIYARTNGTPGAVVRNSAAIYGETSSAFSAITAYVPSGQSNALSGITQSSDPGSWAGYFQAVTGTAVFASTASNVGGAVNPVAVYGESTGTGSSGAAFRINNAANTYSSLYSYTNGLGSAGTFNILNATNNNSTIFAGSTGTGSAGNFSVNNASSGAAALYANTNGTGAAIMGNTSTGFAAIHGLGTNTTNGVLGRIEGSGNAIWGQVNNGGTGSAGNFEIDNAVNSVAAMTASTNGTGAAIHANQSNNGVAMHLQNGGVRLSTASISTSPITTRAAAYLITSGATSFTFDGTVPMNEGDTFYFFNSQGVSVTVAGASIPASTGRTFIYMGGTLRAF